MKLGYVGLKEIQSASRGKIIKTSVKQTKAKKYAVYANEDIALTKENILFIANACGLSDKLGLNDINCVYSFAKSLILSSRGHYTEDEFMDLKDKLK